MFNCFGQAAAVWFHILCNETTEIKDRTNKKSNYPVTSSICGLGRNKTNV